MRCSRCGSGKLFAFLIPATDHLFKANFTQKNGTRVLIISPTRELATQIFNVAKDLLEFHNKTQKLVKKSPIYIGVDDNAHAAMVKIF